VLTPLAALSVVPLGTTANAVVAANTTIDNGAFHAFANDDPSRQNRVTVPAASVASSLLIPLYDANGEDWVSACNTLSSTSSFLVADIGNPGGPGTSSSPSWAQNFSNCDHSKVGVLGYVDTGYCQVPIATVESQIDSWYSWYGTDDLKGIFFDEVANPSDPTTPGDCLAGTTSALSYYRALARYAHSQSTGQTVAYNFGVNPVSNWPLASATANENADVMIVFEDPYSQYVNYGGSGAAWAPATWESAYASSHFSILAYDAVTGDQPATFCSNVTAQNIRYAFVTPNDGWLSLAPSSFLTSELTNC
jgi:hypothetical protein